MKTGVCIGSDFYCEMTFAAEFASEEHTLKTMAKVVCSQFLGYIYCYRTQKLQIIECNISRYRNDHTQHKGEDVYAFLWKYNTCAFLQNFEDYMKMFFYMFRCKTCVNN